MLDIHNIIGRLAMAKENIIQGQKRNSEAMQWLFDRNSVQSPSMVRVLDVAICHLETAIHELKTVKENILE